jgi:molybdopterin-guanine dinucleotide biosynthesis protein A
MDYKTMTGLLLAGGMGHRMGGCDKGLIEFDGQAMASHVIDRLRPQVGPLLINANRTLEVWRSYGLPVISDTLGGFVGPLAGIHAGLHACTTPWLVTAPCDSPFLPLDLVQRLATAAENEKRPLAVARSGGRLQPVFALWHRDQLPALQSYLESGGRKLEAWFESRPRAVVDFNDTAAFANINTPDELTRLQAH